MRSVKKKIVITSTGNNFKALRAGLSRRGFTAVSFPAIKITPLRFTLPGSDHDWVVFTSKNAVNIFVKRAGKRFFKNKKIASIGAETAAMLALKGLKTGFVHKKPGSRDFVREFSRRFTISGGKFLLPVSSEAGDAIASGLSEKGGMVRTLTVYKTGKPRVSPQAARSFVNNGPYYFVLFASPSAFRNFIAIKGFGGLLAKAHTAAIGPATASAMKTRGVTPDITGKTASFRDVLEEIMTYKGGKYEKIQN